MLKLRTGALLLALMATVIYSCKKSSTGGGGGEDQSLTVTVSKTTISADGFEETQITVKDQNGNPVNDAVIAVNGNYNPSYTFSTPYVGTYQITAKRSSIVSPAVAVTATDPGPSPFSQKVYVEDYTGTWCGYCPRVGHSLENYKSNNPDAIVVGVHGPAGSSDPFTFSYISQLAQAFNITGYPTAVVNRNYKWNENTNVLDDEMNRRAPLGLSLNTSVNGSDISVTVKVKYDVSTSLPMKLVVLLLEDGLVYPQVNYYAPTYGGNPITNYVHNHTLRKTLTDIFGDAIPVEQQTKGNTWEKNLQVSAAGYNINNCKIVAFVQYGTNPQGRKGMLNAQSVAAGDSQDFE